MNILTKLADTVAAEINNAGLFPEFTAERVFIPEYDLKTTKALKVSVVPKAVKVINIARDMHSKELQVDIGIQQKISDDEYIEVLLYLAEQLVGLFDKKRLPAMPEAVCVKIENDPVYDPETLRQYRQFLSVVTLTFKVMS